MEATMLRCVRFTCTRMRKLFVHVTSTEAAISRDIHVGSALPPLTKFNDLRSNLNGNSKLVIYKHEPCTLHDAQLTRSEIMDSLADLGVPHKLTSETGSVQTRCSECGNNYAYVSHRTNRVMCAACGYECTFDEHKSAIAKQQRSPLPRRPVAEKTIVAKDPTKDTSKFCSEGGSERANFEEQLQEKIMKGRIPTMDELDTDLYDRVSYLNLMSQFEETERRRKLEEMERLRRLREEAENLSSREGDPSGTRAAVSGMVARPDSQVRRIWDAGIDFHDFTDHSVQSAFLSLRKQLGIDRISLETLSRFYIKGHLDSYDHPAICYPRYRGPSGRGRVPLGLKVIRKIGDRLDKENYPEPDESGNAPFSGIFGFHMATPSDHRIVLTTNERDALAVYESTGGMLSIALPQGEKLDLSVIPHLEDFDTIYLWFPQVHERFAKDYAAYLNANRCFIISHKERPIELVRNDLKKEVNRAIREDAIRVRHKGFRSMIDVRQDIKSEIVNSRSRLYGFAQWKRFDVLNRYLLGFRPGEMTVVTGGTGFGKTTFICEYSLDLLSQGVRTLFCSFEMPEEKILKWMVVQYAALPLYRVEHHPSVEMWLDRFERTKGDLVVMRTEEFRNKTISQIATAIKEQVISGGIQHVVIDNLQFLVGLALMNNERSTALDKFNQQDRLVGFLRSIATDCGPHITLVVHPRKTDADAELDIQHFGGSARVTQEADTVLVIQRRRDGGDRQKGRKYLLILKNRYGQKRVEGDVIEMIFQPATYTHVLIDHSVDDAGPSSK